ncbi:major facilitator superfamily domain-containing protein [Dichotomocladium elegans]|nr:major facilitator superfamily domain-containing protein [Dichotomocladium elegans]
MASSTPDSNIECNEITLTSEFSQNELKKQVSAYEDEKSRTAPPEENQEVPSTYPGLVECAPFPALGSLNEITLTLSKTQTNRTNTDGISYADSIATAIQEEPSKGESSSAIGDPYWTEGWRNPGWLAVIATFLVNFTIFGTVFSWGNFQKLYLRDVYAGQTDSFKIAFVGTSANAMLLSMGLFISPFLRRLGFRGTMVIGTVLAPLGLVLASFATELWQVYLSQGILFGLGGAFVFSPSITLPSQWFVKNRALATGIAVSGSGVGGVCLSPMSQSLIATIGYRNTLRTMGGMGFGLLCVATTLAVSRYPPPSDKKSGGSPLRLFERSLFTWPFNFVLVFSILVPFGYVAPFFLTPTYASVIGASDSMGSSLVSIMSAANVLCRITLGYVGDRYGRVNVIFIFTLLSGIFTMIVWQFADTFNVFVVYCVLFGLTGGGFVSLLPPVIAEIVGIEKIQQGISVSYFLTMFGNLLGTPISGLLQSQFGWTAAIQFPGAMTVGAAIAMLVARLLVNPNIFKKV